MTKHKQITMKTIKLNAKEIQDQKNYAKKCLDLIQRELAFGDLVNLENVASYTKSYKYHLQLAENGYVNI